jgi:hypothetical protein
MARWGTSADVDRAGIGAAADPIADEAPCLAGKPSFSDLSVECVTGYVDRRILSSMERQNVPPRRETNAHISETSGT